MGQASSPQCSKDQEKKSSEERCEMPKRRQSGRGGGRKARRTPMQRRHLYLVLDDWSMGYSIRKIDDPASECCYAGLQPLSRPIYQLEAPRGMAMGFTASLGSKIMVAHPLHNEAQTFDARSMSLIYGPRPHGVPHRRPTFIPFGCNRLCALWGGSLQLLQEQESSELMWSWCKLWKLPFDEAHVTSYAVHPDGRTILVSVEKGEPQLTLGITSGTTFFLDVDDESANHCVLKAEVGWSLPFQGRCYFVGELNAWVGLSGSYDSIGHLCACPLVTSDSTSPSWKIGKESLFSNSLAESHVGATLVYMGNKSEFCLVECISVGYSYICEGPTKPPSFDALLQFKDKLFHPLLRLTMFSLMVDENGDLTTGDTCRFQYYSMPESASRSSMECPVVFSL